MANYSLVINSKFKPFSYQEMLSPVLMATQAQQNLEDIYSDLDTKSSIWDGLTEGSTKAHKIYKTFENDLRQQAEELSKYGLTPSSRQAILRMRGRYSKDIVPIEQAYQRRKEQVDEQRKAMLNNPTLLLSRRADTTNLDEYLDNPSLSYESYSGALLTQQVSQAASALAKDARNDPKVQTELRELLPYQYEAIRRTGFDPEVVRQAILNSPNANKILTGIVDTVVANSKIGDWSVSSPKDKAAILKQARDYANQGLWSAIGQTQYQMISDNYGAKKAAVDAPLSGVDKIKMYDLNPTTYYSESEVAKQNKQTELELNKWRNLGYFDDNGSLTPKGKKALGTEPKSSIKVYAVSGHFPYDMPVDNGGDLSFIRWATQHGVTNLNDASSQAALIDYYRNTRAAIARGELPQGSANFDVYRLTIGQDTDANTIAKKIGNSIGEDGYIYEAGNLSNGAISKGKKYSYKEFKEMVKGNPIIYISNSPASGQRYDDSGKLISSGQQMVELSNGKRFLLNDGVLGNDAIENLSNTNLRIQQAASDAEMATELSNAHSYLSSILTTAGGTEIKPNDGTTIFDILNGNE